MKCKRLALDVLVYVKSAHVLQIQTVLLVFFQRFDKGHVFFSISAFRSSKKKRKKNATRPAGFAFTP